MVVSRPLARSFRKYFGPGSECRESSFGVVVPQYDRNPRLRGCPGDGNLGRCRRSVKNPAKQCREYTKDVIKAMARTFGPGSTQIRTVTIGEFRGRRERGILVQTSYKNTCLTQAASDGLALALAAAMKKGCQVQMFVAQDGHSYFEDVLYS